MIHAVYIKYVPKGMWYLFSICKSAETAISEKEAAIKEALKDGNKRATAAIKTFDTALLLPGS